jgi:hypothetical protein
MFLLAETDGTLKLGIIYFGFMKNFMKITPIP